MINYLRFLKALGYKYYEIDHKLMELKFDDFTKFKTSIDKCTLCGHFNKIDLKFIKSDIMLLGFRFDKNYFLGFEELEFYKSFLIKCDRVNNLNCLMYINSELNLIKPKLILTLGINTFKTLLNLNTNLKLDQIRGSFINFNGFKVLPTFDLLFLRKNPSFKDEFNKDIALARKYIN